MSDALATTKSAPRRRWLRFSLRTLVLVVLVTGSGATLWWNWGPWGVAYTLEEPGPIQEVFFSDDDAYVMVACMLPEGPRDTMTVALDIRRVDTGKRHALLKDWRGWDSTSVKGSYTFLQTDPIGLVPPLTPSIRVFNWLQMRELALPEALKRVQPERAEMRDMSRDHLLIAHDNKIGIYNLPGFEMEREWTSPFFGGFLSDGRLVSLADNAVEVTDFKTGKSVKSPVLDPPMTGWSPTHSNRYLYLNFGDMSSVEGGGTSVALMDTESGKIGPKEHWHLFEFSPDGRLALSRHDRDEPVELINMGDGKVLTRFDPAADMEFNSGSNLILHRVANKYQIYDANDSKLRWNMEAAWARFTDNGLFLIRGGETSRERRVFTTTTATGKSASTPTVVRESDPYPAAIHDARNGKVLLDFSAHRYRDTFHTARPGIVFGHSSSDFVTHESLDYGDSPSRMRARVWRLYRPVEWYGIAWLPEFWLTAALGTILIWSLRRDRRIGMHA